MKKARLIALFLILVASMAQATLHYSAGTTNFRCDMSDDLGLCEGGMDTGCTEWCNNSTSCTDLQGDYGGTITGSCTGTPVSRCHCDLSP